MDRFEALRDELRAQPCEHTEAWLDRPLREAGPPPINAAFRAVLRKVGHLLLRDVIMQPDPPALRTLNAVDARRLAGWVHDAFSTYENEVHSVHDHPHGDDDLDDDEDDLGDAPIDLPRQREALRAWAVERGLERHLQTPAQQILDDRTERAQLRMLFPFATPTLEDVLTVEGQPDPASQSAARALLGSAQLYLQGIALLTVNDRTQTKAAAALLATPPHPALAALDEQLAAMAQKPSPGSDRLPGTYEPGQTRFALDPPRLVYAEKDRYRRDAWVDLVVMFLARGRASEPCDPHGRALLLSPYRTAALAGARRLLRDADAGSRPALIHWLEMPAWGHALRALDTITEARPATVFGFRIKVRPNGHASVDLVALEQTDAGRPRFADARRVSLARLTDPRDLLAASLLEHERHRLGEITLERVLRALVGHPRVFFEKPQNPVRVVVAEPTLEVRPVERGEGVTLTLSAHGRQLITPILRDMLAQGPLSVRFEPARGLVELVEWTPPLRAVAKILAGGETVFPPEAYATLLHQLEKLGPTVPVALPDELLGEPTPPDLRPLVRVDAEAFPSLTVELRARPIAGGAAFVPGEGRARVHASTGGTLVHTVRALDEERARAQALVTTLALPAPAPDAPPFTFALAELDAVGAFARALEAQGEAVAVEWSRPVPIRTLERGALRVEVRARRDWFAIGGEATVDGGELALATLVEAARQGKRFTALPTGGLVELEASLRHELAALGDHARPTREGDLEITTTAAPTLLGLLPDARALDAAPAMARTLARLRDAQDHEPAVPPPMASVLRPYQRDGFAWLSRLAAWSAGAVLADDMGLGKTIQTLALLLSRAALGPALVVAPTSVVRNWLDELAKFGAGLTPVLLRGPGRAARIAQGFSAGEVVVTSYDLAARDVEALAGVRFATLVVDEAQAVKNANTTRAKALRALQADFVVALTGTPIENHLGELWSILRIACPGLLGSWEWFRERFALPIEARADAVARASLSRLLRPFVLRRTKEAVAPELPPLTELVRVVELGAKERAGYEAARQAAVAALEQRGDAPTDRFAALAALMRLRRLACHPRLVDPTRGAGAESSKLAAFLELADEIVESGHRALVFSQFTDHLAVVREALTEKGHRFQYLDGSTPAAARGDEVAAFQGGTAPFFLISLRAGGTGLNLTAADYVVHLDPWWNPAVEDQATDRAHRIGQDRAVTVVRLVARATIEEAVLTLHEAKRALAADILEGTDAAAKLSTRELVELVRAAPAPTDDEPVEVATDAAPPTASPSSLEVTEAGLEHARARLLRRLASRGQDPESPTARSYLRALDRFAEFVRRTASSGAVVAVEPAVTEYLAALASGAFEAPKSERGVARTALGHLVAALAG